MSCGSIVWRMRSQLWPLQNRKRAHHAYQCLKIDQTFLVFRVFWGKTWAMGFTRFDSIRMGLQQYTATYHDHLLMPIQLQLKMRMLCSERVLCKMFRRRMTETVPTACRSYVPLCLLHDIVNYIVIDVCICGMHTCEFPPWSFFKLASISFPSEGRQHFLLSSYNCCLMHFVGTVHLLPVCALWELKIKETLECSTWFRALIHACLF